MQFNSKNSAGMQKGLTLAAGQRAGVERGGRRRGTGSRAQGPRGAEGRRGAGGAFYWRAGTPPFPPPLTFLPAGAGRPALPRTRPPRRGPAPGRDRCQSRGIETDTNCGKCNTAVILAK